MKKILILILTVVCVSLQAQSLENEMIEFRYSTAPRYTSDLPVERPLKKVKHFEDLTDREKWLLLEKIEDAYFTFNKKEINPSTLLVYMESENPIVEWSGKHEEGEDGKLIRLFAVDRKYILQIFDL